MKLSINTDASQFFREYVYSFYGTGGVYPLLRDGIVCTLEDVTEAIDQLCIMESSFFAGDSIDRETVRRALEENGFSEESK